MWRTSVARSVVVALQKHHFVNRSSDLKRAETQGNLPEGSVHHNIVLAKNLAIFTEFLTQVEIDETCSTNDTEAHGQASAFSFLNPAAPGAVERSNH